MVENKNMKRKVTMCYCLTNVLCVHFPKIETYLYIRNMKQKISSVAPFFVRISNDTCKCSTKYTFLYAGINICNYNELKLNIQKSW